MYRNFTTLFFTRYLTEKLLKINLRNQILAQYGRFTTEPPTNVDFDFKTLSDGSTFVSIQHYGFDKTGDELLEVIKDSTGGFTMVLAGLKAFLEYNIDLNLILDKFPKEIMQHGNK